MSTQHPDPNDHNYDPSSESYPLTIYDQTKSSELPPPSEDSYFSNSLSTELPLNPSTPQSSSSPSSSSSDIPTPSSPFPTLQIGTFIIIGAVATNVIGFRYSRWAVGKEIHRAWERRQHNTSRGHSTSSRTHASRAESMRREQARQRAAQEEARNTERAQAYTKAHEQDRRAREEARAQYEGWERRFGGRFWQQTNFKMNIDPKILEEILKAQRGMGANNPFSMHAKVIEEMMKMAQQAQRDSRRSGRRMEEDFDPFRFWEQMNNANWSGFDQNIGTGGSQRMGKGMFDRAYLERHYTTLGVNSKASEREVKEAYRKQVMKWHPDRYRGNRPDEAAKKFREVTEAYNALMKNR